MPSPQLLAVSTSLRGTNTVIINSESIQPLRSCIGYVGWCAMLSGDAGDSVLSCVTAQPPGDLTRRVQHSKGSLDSSSGALGRPLITLQTFLHQNAPSHQMIGGLWATC